MQRHQLIRENQHLKHAEQTRLQREHDEADPADSRAMGGAGGVGAARPTPPPAAAAAAVRDGESRLPAELIAHYRELLRIYVIMGSGNLSYELRRLAEMLVVAGLTARQTMQLHLQVLEDLVHGLAPAAPGT